MVVASHFGPFLLLHTLNVLTVLRAGHFQIRELLNKQLYEHVKLSFIFSNPVEGHPETILQTKACFTHAQASVCLCLHVFLIREILSLYAFFLFFVGSGV